MGLYDSWEGGIALDGQMYDHGGQLKFHTLGPSYSIANAAHAITHKLGGSDPILLNELGLPILSVNFNNQEAINFRVENRTSDPVAPEVGRLWIRTDL